MSYGSRKALRPNVLCPYCLSLERHRLLWLYLRRQTDFFTAPQKLLHIAPEQCFYRRFKAMPHLQYTTGDLESPLAAYHFDLHHIPFEDNSFDTIFCNHVLEHVDDADRCMRELHRVLKPGGWGVLQVPIDYSRQVTLEDDSITSPQQREEHYWQKDHLRLFGRDYPQRLARAGFSVIEVPCGQGLTPEEISTYRLQAWEIIYRVEK